jgi:hypothetical protein
MAIRRDTTPSGVRKSALIAAISLTVAAAWFGYCAIVAERAGKVMNWEKRFGEPVRREVSPAPFRQNTNYTWFATAFCAVLAATSFGYSRKLRDYS